MRNISFLKASTPPLTPSPLPATRTPLPLRASVPPAPTLPPPRQPHPLPARPPSLCPHVSLTPAQEKAVEEGRKLVANAMAAAPPERLQEPLRTAVKSHWDDETDLLIAQIKAQIVAEKTAEEAKEAKEETGSQGSAEMDESD
ncbi:hypothetical protein K491DRAFT_683481 [Lophiostoma macrostomum CBS 122681]|uniref:Uncharacterized protein n=1 Tax=Lophiostoma macrostomum CBS 122681 TaxID=1314788 RepID=A0A6A6SPX2_9PLEO|nr:hypothetical protein K491DRAFT_683481 [Lophiostoma macrostomum CBS 122681]